MLFSCSIINFVKDISKNLSNSRRVSLFLLSLVALCLTVLFFIFGLTSPDDASSTTLIIIFTLIYVLSFGSIGLFFDFITRLYDFFTANLPVKKRLSWNSAKKYRIIALISFLPVAIMAMQSIKPIGIFEIFLLFALCLFGVVIISKKQY